MYFEPTMHRIHYICPGSSQIYRTNIYASETQTCIFLTSYTDGSDAQAGLRVIYRTYEGSLEMYDLKPRTRTPPSNCIQ